MTKKVQKKTVEKEVYEAPRIEVIEVDASSVLCASPSSSASGDKLGGTFGEDFTPGDNWSDSGRFSNDRLDR